MFKSKKLLASSLTILLSTTAAYAVDPAPVGPRSVKVPAATGNIATFSSGIGLDRGNIPITAVKMGYFMIPNGAGRNPALANSTPVTFQKVGNNWTAFVNGVAQLGDGAPVYFSEDALNYPVSNNLRIGANGQIQWEDTVGGVPDYNDAVLNVSVPHTEINDTSQLVLSNGVYQIPLIIKFKVQETGVSTEAGYSNSVGHYFADALGNPLSGYVDFANIRTSIGATSNQNYSGNSPFGSGSTLQYEFPATVVADVAGANIVAVDVSTVPAAGGNVILQISQSTKLGSVGNTSGRVNNLLSVQVLPSQTLTLTGTGGVMFNGGGVAINNYVGLKEIYGTTANTAIVEVANQGFEISLNAPVGASGKLQTFRLLNSSVELKQALATNTIEFANSTQVSALKLTGGIDLANTNITTASTNRIHNVWVYGDQNITGNIGTANNPFGVFKIYNDKKVKVNTVNFYSDVYTGAVNTGTVEFVQSGAISYSLGESGNYLKSVQFTESAEVRGSAYSKNINVPSGKTASFRKRITKTGATDVTPYVRTPSGFILEGVGSTANFGDQASVYSPAGTGGDITTGIAGEGIVNFEGAAEVRMQIGTASQKVKQVTFVANDITKNVILARDIHATNISLTKANYIIDAGATLDGITTASSPTINFGQHVEIFKGQATFSGTPVFNVYFDNVSNSHLTVTDPGSNVNLASATSLTFNVTDNSTLPPASGRTYYFFRMENGGTLTQIDPTKVIVNQPLNPFVKWSYSYGNLTQVRDVNNGLQKIVQAAGGNINNIPAALKQIDPNSNGSAALFLQDLATLSATNLASAGDSLRRVIQATNPTGQVAINTSQSALSSIVAARISNSQLFQFRLSEADGVAAGGDLSEFRRGVWISPFINQANQRATGDDAGYKSKAYGGTIGLDGKITDDLTLGIAGTYLNTTINYKDFKTGDKTKMDTYLGSLYGLYNLPKNWFVQGVASFATNNIKNTKPRITPTDIQTAAGKYHSNTYGLEAMVGYDYKNSELLNIIPLAGIRYGRFVGDRYTEQGTTNQNLYVSKKTVDKTEAVLGVRVATFRDVKEYAVIPEVHGFINYNLRPKSPKIDVRLDGMDPMPVLASKPARALYNLGANLLARKNMMEYELGYDSFISKKYIAHQGTLKIKLNF